MVEGDISFEGSDQMEDFLKQAQKRTKDFTPMWPHVRDTLNFIMFQRFQSRNFGNWKNHSPATSILSNGKASKVLVRSGRLMRSLTRPGASGSVFRTSKNKMIFGTTVPYADIHNKGAEIPVTQSMRRMFAGKGVYLTSEKSKITIPKRRIMFITSRNIARLKRTVKQYSETQIFGGAK